MTDDKKLSRTKQALYDTVMASLEEGVIPWHQPWLSARPVNATTEGNYNGINRAYLNFMTVQKGYSDNRWATFKQADNAGWKIKKGSKGVPVEFYSKYEVENKKTFYSNDYITEVTKGMSESQREKWIMDNVRTNLQTYIVFNGQDIEGIPPLEIKNHDIDTVNARCEQMLKSSDCKINIARIEEASFSPLLDTIELPTKEQFDSMQDFYSVAFHEMAHSTGHSSRLNRNNGVFAPYGTKEYAAEELRAEIASMFVEQNIGANVAPPKLDNHTAYIQSWIKNLKDDPSILFNSFFDATKIESYLFDKEKEYVASLGTTEEKTVEVEAQSFVQTQKQTEQPTQEKVVEQTTTQRTYSEVEKKAYREKMLTKDKYANSKRLEAIEKNVPAEMKEIPNWVVFRYVTQPVTDRKTGEVVKDENGKIKFEKVKKMYDVNKGVDGNFYMKFADPTGKATWTTFEKALAFAKENNCAGLSIAMDNSGMTCIDVDKLSEKESAKLMADRLLKEAGNTYAEKSVSGNGIHIFVKGNIGEGYMKRKGDIECYHSGRFMSVTGNLIDGHNSEVKDMPANLKETLRIRLGKAIEVDPNSKSVPSQLSDDEVVAKVLASKSMGSDFERLMSGGDLSGDISADDYRFCKMLSYHSQDYSQVERIFRQYRHRDKKPDKYYSRTANKAVASTQVNNAKNNKQDDLFMQKPKPDRQLQR